ncbi:MAG: hypothetical protein WB766_02235, partial [Roseiarcus sp.]
LWHELLGRAGRDRARPVAAAGTPSPPLDRERESKLAAMISKAGAIFSKPSATFSKPDATKSKRPSGRAMLTFQSVKRTMEQKSISLARSPFRAMMRGALLPGRPHFPLQE